MTLYKKDLISINDLSRDDIKKIFEVTDLLRENIRKGRNLLKGFVLTNAFFEPSTRTRLSFESAMLRLGGSVISFSSVEAISIAKGESFVDTIRMLDAYSDIIVVRHKYEGAAKLAAEISEAPVINAGDGRNQHPTQTLVDLYTIVKKFGKIDGLNIGLFGDLKYARTANSLLQGLAIFNPSKIFLISPPTLKIRKEIRDLLNLKGIKFEEHDDVSEVISELDVLYVLRIQRERFSDPLEYEKVKGSYRVTLDLLKDVKDDFIIMHPLPRVDEIDYKVDGTKYAYYFKQAKYGIPIRMALLTLILLGEEVL